MLYCIIGKSSTGKDTIFKELLADKELNLINVVPYTTRPIRANETDGVEYHFVTPEARDELIKLGKVIELRTYNTCHGPWDYFTVDDDMDLENQDYLIIGTLEAFEKIKDYYGKEKVYPIYIEVEDGLRLKRALDREMNQENPKYSEMCRRFLSDAEDFAKEKLEKAEVKHIFENIDKDETVKNIKKYIMDKK